MATLREYFLTEANELLAQIDAALNRLDANGGSADDLARLAKALRGSAHLARETRVYRAGLGLEAAARAIGAGRIAWNGDVSSRARRTVEDLYALVQSGESDDQSEARVRRVLDRWAELNVDVPAQAAQGGLPASGERSMASRQFREFAAHEVAGITAEIDSSLTQLGHDTRNREALKAIVRRQRALLGAARLDEIKVVAEVLRAIEDVARVIVKLNVAVKDEWLAVFRAARDVLSNSLEPLRQGNDPVPSPALSTLRTVRSELIDRYGEGDAVSVVANKIGDINVPAEQLPAAPLAASTTTAGTAGADEIVPIEDLCYKGERALRRALELRAQLESLAGESVPARESVDELFDLIRLGIG